MKKVFVENNSRVARLLLSFDLILVEEYTKLYCIFIQYKKKYTFSDPSKAPFFHIKQRGK